MGNSLLTGLTPSEAGSHNESQIGFELTALSSQLPKYGDYGMGYYQAREKTFS